MFIEQQFPVDISFGSSGGPTYRTSVVEALNGSRKKNKIWSYPLHRYDVSYALKTMEQLEAVIEFFHQCEGRAHEFRFKDWADFKSCSHHQQISLTDQQIGIGDGIKTNFQLIKSYGTTNPKTRPISKPIENTLLVAIDGVLTESYTVSDKGVLQFDTAPSPGVNISAGFEFDVPCEFGADEMETSLDMYKMGSISLPIQEVRL